MERIGTLNRRLNELEVDADKHESEISAILQELAHSPISLTILQQTKIGMTVNKVRKVLPVDSLANQAALRLIVAWKEVAKAAMGPPAPAAAAATASAVASVSPAAATPATAAASSSSSSAASTAPKRKADSLCTPSSSHAAAATSDPKRAKTGSSLVAPTRSPVRSASPNALPPPTISLATLAAAHPPLPVLPPATLLYNPNLAYYNDRARIAAAAASAANAPAREIDYTSRKQTGRSSAGDSFLPQSNGSALVSSEPVALCSLLDMCADHVAHHLDKIPGPFFLDATPTHIMLRVLAKANEQQLAKYEAANSSLLGETECLWRALCRRTHPGVSEASKPAESTWKAWYASLGKRKEDKLAALQSKLQKAMQQDMHDKKSATIKTISHGQAVCIENKERGGGGTTGKVAVFTPAQAAAAAAQGKGPAAGKLSLAAIKQQTKSFAKSTWTVPR